jgi:hypothetical protein
MIHFKSYFNKIEGARLSCSYCNNYNIKISNLICTNNYMNIFNTILKLQYP